MKSLRPLLILLLTALISCAYLPLATQDESEKRTKPILPTRTEQTRRPASIPGEGVVQRAIAFVQGYEVLGFNQWQVISSASEIPYEQGDRKDPANYQDVIVPPTSEPTDNGQTLFTAYAWSPDNGTLTRWEITIRGEDVVFVHAEIVDTMVGHVTNIRTLGQYIPRAGKLLVNEQENIPLP